MRVFLSIPNGDNVTGPKEKEEKAGDLHVHVRPVARFFFSFVWKFIFSVVYVWTGVASKGRQPTTATAAATTPTARYVVLLFFIYFLFLLSLKKNEEINKSEKPTKKKPCWFSRPKLPNENNNNNFVSFFLNNVPYFFL